MNTKSLKEEFYDMRVQSQRMLPVAAVLFAALSAVVFLGGLHKSELAFIPGILIGTFGFWVILEAMTARRCKRILDSLEKNS